MVKQKMRQIIICSTMLIFTLILTGCEGVIIQAPPTPTSAAAESMQPESSSPEPTEAAMEEAVAEDDSSTANAQATADAETTALAVSEQATAQAASATAQAVDMQATAEAASFNATALAVSNQATAEAAGADATAQAVSAQATANAGSANATALAVSNQATAQAVAAQATAQVVAAQATTQASGPTIRIDRPSVNVRNGPGTTYDVVTGANANEQFSVVGRNDAGDWYEITLANGTRAWIFSGIVQPSGDFSNVAVTAAAPPTAAPIPPTVAPVAAAPTAPPAPVQAAPVQAAPVQAAPVQPTAVQAAPVVAPTAAPVAPTVAPAPAPVQPAPAAVASTAGLRGRLLYSVANMDANRWELWEFVLDNGTSKKVADWRTEIDVSRDGSQIVYFAWPSDAGEEAGTWIMDRNYSNNRLVVPGGAYASFSPGGDRLVLNGGPDIYVIRTDATGVRQLTRGEYPSWSPVNDQIVHRACVGGDCGLWIIDANSSDPSAKRRLTTGGSDGQPAWSPNGQRIAYISQDDGNFEIYVVNADGTGKTRLTNDAASDGLPEWSPDGQWIAFRSDRGGTWAIYAMRADGSDLRKIVDADVLPRWFFEKMSWF